MSEPTRQDLTVSRYNATHDEWEDTRRLTDAEFDRIAKDNGYIKIDGPDYEGLVHETYEAGYDRGYDDGYDDGFRSGREDEASYHM